LIGHDGEQFGIVPLEVALQKSQDIGLDLMEVSPNAKPPVCKILDHGKLKYEEKKKQQINKKKAARYKIEGNKA